MYLLITGRGNHRKLLSLRSCSLTELQKRALVGIHSFTGCDQNSSLLRKGKMKCWKVAQNHLQSFCDLGNSYEISDALVGNLEEYICNLYGVKGCDVDSARNKIFWDTLKRKKKVIDLSMLPPCKKSLLLHIKRSNYISRIWRQASVAEMDIQNAQNHGWNLDFSLQWNDEAYPHDLELLLERSEDSDDDDDDSDHDELYGENDDESDVFIRDDEDS